MTAEQMRETQGPALAVPTAGEEIFPGVYGRVCVYSAGINRGGGFRVWMKLTNDVAGLGSFSHEELTDAISTLSAIRDAMRENEE